MPKKKVRVGVVGIGYLGNFHAQKYAAIPDAELVGLVDIVPARAREMAEKLGTQSFESHQSLIGRVDAVSVVVPTDGHHSVARDFLAAGCDVLVEKPLCATVEEAEDLTALARQGKRILQVGHLERFNPAIQAVAEKIRSPLYFECRRLTPFRGRGTEVDVVLDLMIHDLDIVLSLTRAKVEYIHAVGAPVLTDKIDIASARIVFENGCAATLTASRVSARDQRQLHIFQPDGYFSLDFTSRQAAFFHRMYNEGNRGFQLQPEKLEVNAGDTLESEIRSFLHCCRTRTEPTVSGEDGVRVLDLALKVDEEIETNLKKVSSIAPMSENLPQAARVKG
ncbi:MAG TPA: Gfo/Idh/MocA family oxidoreductase [Thermodesulfobacteriota bacterium]|nr:Gfo/Idh/MocA family oxidoreductase [Thermodesulfobacteriota bacterium]